MKNEYSNIWEIENNFYLRSDASRLKKAVCHYEVFKKTIKVPGSIVECGVFKGTSLIRLLTYRDLLQQKSKKIYGFDSFGKFPKQLIQDDNKFALNHDKVSGLGLKSNKLKKFLFNKKFKNFELIKGDVVKTLPNFLKKNTKLKISFLHLDMDVYEPTKFALETLFKKVSKNGIVLIDDYGYVSGATKATNEFVKDNKLRISKLNFDKRLSFIIKN